MNRQSGIVIGLIAGVAAGLMAAAALRAGSAALIMLLAAPVAVYLASLGWGTLSGFIAATIASAVAAATGGATGVVTMAVLLFFPAAWGGHLLNLGQRTETGMIWYPLSSVFVRLTLAIAVGIIIAGGVLGFSSEALERLLGEMLRELLQASQSADQIDEEALARNARLYAAMIPFVVPAIWLTLHVTSFYISAVIAHRSGRMARPRDDIPATITLPFEASGLPLAGLVGMVVAPSPLYEISAVLAGVGITAFAMVGLAELHLTSRGRPGRGLLLSATYILILLFSVPILIFAAMGLVRAWRRRGTPPTGQAGQGPPSTI